MLGIGLYPVVATWLNASLRSWHYIYWTGSAMEWIINHTKNRIS